MFSLRLLPRSFDFLKKSPPSNRLTQSLLDRPAAIKANSDREFRQEWGQTRSFHGARSPAYHAQSLSKNCFRSPISATFIPNFEQVLLTQHGCNCFSSMRALSKFRVTARLT
jgi:hypothetical protein